MLWATGAATVTAGQAEAAGLTFPAPGESLYLMSYLGMAGFLLLDVPRRRLPTSAIWLEAAVVCGAATCVAALAVLSPAASIFARGGLALLLAVLYPLLDLVLGLLVLAQMLLGQRARSRRTLALAGGFLVMTAADCAFVLGLGTEAYTSNLWLDLVWGIAFLLLVGAACTPPPPVQVTERQSAGWLLGAAAAVAVLILVVRPGGTTGWLVTAPAAMTLASAGVRMVQALRDARGKAEALRLSLTDEPTGLPNRRALLARADAAIATDEPFGLMLLDLDGFKDINDSIGHGAGDEVLTVVANRLTDAVGPGRLLARLGGDEFALFVPSDDEPTMLESAQALRASLLDPVPVEGLEPSVDASVGVTACEAGDQSATALLRRADIAMYEAKRTRSGALLFDRAQDGYSRERLRRGEDLRTALTAGQARGLVPAAGRRAHPRDHRRRGAGALAAPGRRPRPARRVPARRPPRRPHDGAVVGGARAGAVRRPCLVRRRPRCARGHELRPHRACSPASSCRTPSASWSGPPCRTAPCSSR
ncbi:hypothetical protein GCM10025868_20670 [Angustibacter aerolatus]|uniref:GGDEF domain-containing protein n=1 Tax=Angustibacter aerolatus TaxID=1162965 RepID=A0ABQ6JF34_9ACTN|nr:hypothetical protein GCM10025868_20670 [Angustibacter aerolatus]